jgi:hypothetical protein
MRKALKILFCLIYRGAMESFMAIIAHLPQTAVANKATAACGRLGTQPAFGA